MQTNKTNVFKEVKRWRTEEDANPIPSFYVEVVKLKDIETGETMFTVKVLRSENSMPCVQCELSLWPDREPLETNQYNDAYYHSLSKVNVNHPQEIDFYHLPDNTESLDQELQH